jgi:hypothetical protein
MKSYSSSAHDLSILLSQYQEMNQEKREAMIREYEFLHAANQDSELMVNESYAHYIVYLLLAFLLSGLTFRVLMSE